jgi:hypothetical protein
MPWDQVMHKWGSGSLHSGSKSGPKVKSQAQAVAIMLSEKRKAKAGKKEYQGEDEHPFLKNELWGK